MNTTTSVSLDEYLNTSYEPDMDFVDGALVGRNVGTPLHSILQGIIAEVLRSYRKQFKIQVLTEGRLRITPTRHRIPDVMVLRVPFQKLKVIVDVPVIVVEIKSPDDSMKDLEVRCSDYAQLGVANILVMDPEQKRIWTFLDGVFSEIFGTAHWILLEHPSGITFPFAEMFAELDE